MLEISAIQINIHDMDEALDFYCRILGFEIENKDNYPITISLKHDGNFFLLLTKVSERANAGGVAQARTLLNFRVNEDLIGFVEKLKLKGVFFLSDTPSPCPVGLFIPFSDPSGNIHEFVQFR